MSNMPTRAVAVALAAVVAIAVPSPAVASVAAVGAIQDNTLYEDNNGNLSNGAGDFFFAGITQSRRVRRGVIAFDLAAAGIPAGSTINSVTVRLFLSRSRSADETVSLHRLTAGWGEGTSDASMQEGGGAPSTAGDATWLHRFYPGTLWATAGGDFVATPSASLIVGGPCLMENGPEGCVFVTWGSTAGLVADVQAWVDGTEPNHGWIVIGREVDRRGAKRFNSRTHPDVATRPLLTIDYTPPGAQGACCLGGGVCDVLSPADCASQEGFYNGDGTDCTPNPCTAPTGACCAGDGSCTELSQSACDTGGGSYLGDLTICTPNPCPQPTGACCAPSGLCSEETAVDCASGGGTYAGDGTTCASTECPVVLTAYLDPLPVPVPATPVAGSPGGAATYDIAMVELQQQLHSELPPTTVWGYDDGTLGPAYPGPTVEAGVNQTVVVNWINDLRDVGTGFPRTDHYLAVDTNCIHGAENTAKTVVHLHGGHVTEQSDGYPEFTYTPGFQDSYTYPNGQLPATLWYHDHALGVTRLNVYMGLAGFYLLRDPFELGLSLPAGPYEIPLAVQDRRFNPDGSLSYPAVWGDRFAGDKILVNGKVWPYLMVDRGKYRLRILNGSGTRFYTLSLVPPAGTLDFTVIGTEGGLLDAPVPGVGSLTIGPGERYDVVVDFQGFGAGDEILLQNSAPFPYPGPAGVGVVPDVMKFIVTASPGHVDPLPGTLRPVTRLQEGDAVLIRDFRLRKGLDDGCGRTPWLINDLGWDDITEYPELDTVEIWRFINDSGVSHPMHMHLVMFQVLDRDTFTVGPSGEIIPDGNPVPPLPEESGWKDTAVVDPGQILRVIARFEDYKGKYAYHCHILEHEDHEMMRQFQTVRCGDAEVDPTEPCDDGNAAVLDGCAPGCEREERIDLSGIAAGGTVDVVIDGVAVGVTTSPGQSAADVAVALAAAISADPTLAGAGVTAVAIGNVVVVTRGDVTDVILGDAGLAGPLQLFAVGENLWWSTVGGATGYDLVRGDLGALRAGGFAGATLSCEQDGGPGTTILFAADPAPGQGYWFLARDETGGVNGTYDTGFPGQIGPRDGDIAASGNDCL